MCPFSTAKLFIIIIIIISYCTNLLKEYVSTDSMQGYKSVQLHYDQIT